MKITAKQLKEDAIAQKCNPSFFINNNADILAEFLIFSEIKAIIYLGSGLRGDQQRREQNQIDLERAIVSMGTGEIVLIDCCLGYPDGYYYKPKVEGFWWQEQKLPIDQGLPEVCFLSK